MCCFRPFTSFNCGWNFPMMGWGFNSMPFWGGGCCGNNNAFKFGLGVALGAGAINLLGNVLDRYC